MSVIYELYWVSSCFHYAIIYFCITRRLTWEKLHQTVKTHNDSNKKEGPVVTTDD